MKAYLLGGRGVGGGKELYCVQCGAKSNGVGSGGEVERAYLSVFEHVVLKQAKNH